MRKKTQGLNDGYVDIYAVNEKENDFAAEITPKSLDDMTYVVSMAFQEEYKREQDMAFAEALDCTLSLKVRMHLQDEITKKHKVVWNGAIYNVLKIDFNRNEKVMYLYLEEARRIDS